MIWAGVALLVSYLIGGFPTAIYAGKVLRGIDVRDYGSHNAGATNVYRVLGAGPGIGVLLTDAGKGVLCVLGVSAAVVYLAGPGGLGPVAPELLEVICGIGAIVGHIWTVWARFKGGKGVGTSAGVFGALAPWCLLIALVTFAVLLTVFRYVSLGSISAAVVLAGCLVVQYYTYPGTVHVAVVVAGLAIAVLVVVKHTSNIKRLLAGTENTFGRPASAAPGEEP